MSITHPLYAPDPKFETRVFQKNLTNDLGFRNVVPVSMPVTNGQYYGSNEADLYNTNQMVRTNQTGMFFPGNYVPQTAGRPLVNLYEHEFLLQRNNFIYDYQKPYQLGFRV